MLGGRIVEDDDIAPAGVEKTVLQQGEEQHPAGAPSGELDHMRQGAVLLRPVAELVLPVRIMLRRRLPQAPGDRELRNRPDWSLVGLHTPFALRRRHVVEPFDTSRFWGRPLLGAPVRCDILKITYALVHRRGLIRRAGDAG